MSNVRVIVHREHDSTVYTTSTQEALSDAADFIQQEDVTGVSITKVA